MGFALGRPPQLGILVNSQLRQAFPEGLLYETGGVREIRIRASCTARPKHAETNAMVVPHDCTRWHSGDV